MELYDTVIRDYLCGYYLKESSATVFWKDSGKFLKATFLTNPTERKNVIKDCFTLSFIQVNQHLRLLSSITKAT